MVPLVILMVWIGLHPNTLLRKMTPSVEQLIATVERGREGEKAMVADLTLTRRFAAPSPASGRGALVIPRPAKRGEGGRRPGEGR
jgi:hypothetical protein